MADVKRISAQQPSPMPYQKYGTYAYAAHLGDRTWPDKLIAEAPLWCSVDLRDGNQALIDPMDVPRKRQMFEVLVEMGFKEIEVGFPSASGPDFEFCRMLVEEDLVPDDVWIQVLTQSRPELIERTYESIAGANKSIVHLYNPTSELQRRVVYRLDTEGIRDIAVTGTRLCKELARQHEGGAIRFEYSPESFTGTEIDYALEVCNAVSAEWGRHRRRPDHPESACDRRDGDAEHLRRPHRVLPSQCGQSRGRRAVAASSQRPGLRRGGSGVRRHGGCRPGRGHPVRQRRAHRQRRHHHARDEPVQPGRRPELDISHIDHLRRIAEYCNQLPVHPRHPYGGDLVYTAFSGSHQDAIKKGFEALPDDYDYWEVPYLPIDPAHVGRTYQDVIRVNSQSGKGGVAYVMKNSFGLDLPRRLQIEFSGLIQAITDEGGEILPEAIKKTFDEAYLHAESPYTYVGHRSHFDSESSDESEVEATIKGPDGEVRAKGRGNGPLSAFKSALADALGVDVSLVDYHEHAVGAGADATAAAYVEIETSSRAVYWGVGLHPNIVTASFRALLSAINRSHEEFVAR